MKEQNLVEILRKIKVCVQEDSRDVALEYVKAELDNLEGITQERCKNTKYFYYDWNCKYCTNLNCGSNKNVNNSSN